jgi:predicted naringenin-chalcone synthase
MAVRRITESEVEEVLRSYHTRYEDRKGNDIWVGHPGGRRIKVVTARGSDPKLVITAGD